MRLLKDKDLLVKKGASWELREGAEVPFPDSVQALIAARLDTLCARREVDARRRRGRSGKVFWAGAIAADGRARPRPRSPTRCASSRARSSCVLPGAPRSRARPNTPSGTSSPATSPTGSSPEPREPRATSPRPAGSSPRPPSASRTSPTSSPTTTPRPWSSRRPPGRPSRPPSSRHRRCGSSPSPGSARSGWTPPRRSRTSSGRSRSPRPDIPSVPRRSPASARPPLQAGRFAEAAEALEEAIASFRGAGRSPRRRPRDGHARQRASPARGSAAMDAPCGGAGAPGAAAGRRPSSSARSPRWPAPRPSRGGPRTRSAYADRALALAEELGLPRPARALGYRGMARADLGDPGRSRGLPRGDRARDRGRAGTRGGPAPQQPGVGALGRSKAPRRPWRSCARGSPSRRPGGSPRSLDCLTNGHARRARRYRRARRGARGRRRDRSRASRRAGTCSTSSLSAPCRHGSWPCGARPRRRPRCSTGSSRPPAETGNPDASSCGLGSAALARAALGQDEAARRAARRARGIPRRPREPRTTRLSSPRWCAPPWRSAIPSSPSGS